MKRDFFLSGRYLSESYPVAGTIPSLIGGSQGLVQYGKWSLSLPKVQLIVKIEFLVRVFLNYLGKGSN